MVVPLQFLRAALHLFESHGRDRILEMQPQDVYSVTCMHADHSQRYPFYAFLAIAAILVPWLGLADFYTRGEPREALVSQSMLRSGDWILPRSYNDAVPSKPPLFHWIATAASLPCGEVTEFTVRLPSALLALFALGFFLFTLRAALSSRAQLLFTLLLSFSFEWLRAGVSARVDMVHAACLSAGLLATFHAIDGRSRIWWLGAAILLALATLGKGPVAIAIPTIVLVTWIFASGNANLRTFGQAVGSLLLAAVLALSWYGAAYLKAPAEFFDIFWNENIGRFAGTMKEGSPHKHSFLYVLGTLFVGTFPWSPLVLWFALRNAPRSKMAALALWKESPSIVKFSAISAFSIVLFYCIPESKRGVYLLAAYPFMALLVTFGAEREVRVQTLARVLAVACGVVLLAQAVVVPALIAPRRSERRLSEALAANALDGAQIYSFGFEFYGAAFYSRRRFLRLEDAYDAPRGSSKRSIPRSGDLLVVLEPDMAQARNLLQSQNATAEAVGEVSIGKRKVELLRVSSRI